jgi:hypothetical protein
MIVRKEIFLLQPFDPDFQKDKFQLDSMKTINNPAKWDLQEENYYVCPSRSLFHIALLFNTTQINFFFYFHNFTM